MAENTSTTSYQLGRIRKALVAGATAGFAAVVAAVVGTPVTPGYIADGKIDANEVGTALGLFFTVGVPIAYVTWQTPNKQERHASPDVATTAATVAVQNLALPPITADDVARLTSDAPTDAASPAPGLSAAGLPPVAEDGEPKHSL